MDKEMSLGLARRAAPYGLAVLPEQDAYEYTDPRNEVAVEQRWRPVCERHGAAVLGIRDVPTQPVRLELDGIHWQLEPLGTTERAVPAEVYHRWRALESEQVPFFYWLWGEELPERPRFTLLPASSHSPAITTRQPMGVTLRHMGDLLSTWLGEALTTLDPLVIGVIPTAPGRGLWVIIGRWLH